MTKIHNPWRGAEGYECFGCSPDNPHGLRMEFHEEGDEIVSVWNPESHFQGYDQALHGGIHASLMDELASWLVFVKLKTSGVTSSMDVRYLKPAFVHKGPLTIRGKFSHMKRNVAVIECKLFDHTGELCSESTLRYFTVPQDIARERFHYPGEEAFIETPQQGV